MTSEATVTTGASVRRRALSLAAGREISVFVAFLLLAAALTWPLAIRLETAVPDLGDPLLNAWIIDWVCHALIHQPLDLFDAPIFHPAKLPLAFSENLIGVALFAMPFHIAGLPALTVYNIVFLLGFAHAAYGGYVLGRVVTKALVPAIVAGIFFGFVSYKFDHLSHLQIVWSGWLPLLLAALIAYWRRPTASRAALAGVAFLMNGLTNIHFLLFGGIAVVFTIAVLSLFSFPRDFRFWTRLFVALGLAGLILLPVLMPYREVRALYNMQRYPGEVQWGSATWSDWLNATSRARFYRRYVTNEVHAERALFPGLLPIFLLGAGALLTPRRETGVTALPSRNVAQRWLKALDVVIVALAALVWFGSVSERFLITAGGRNLLAVRGVDIQAMLLVVAVLARLTIRFPDAMGGSEGRSLRTAAMGTRFPPGAWAAAAWIAIGMIGSLGLNAFFHTFLYQRVEGFAALRVPARWSVVAYAGLAAWAAIGVAALLSNGSALRRRIVAGLLLVLAAGEVVPIIRWEHAPAGTPSVYRWLNDVRVGPVLELPPVDDASAHFVYLLHATTHRVPIMNGTSGFEPPMHIEMREAFYDRRMEQFTATIERAGCKLIIVHGDRLTQFFSDTARGLRQSMATGRVAFLRRFDNGTNGDYVFAMTRNLPDWQTYRALSMPDPAGFTPEQSLQRFLDGDPTYNASTFGRVDSPRPHEAHQRPLRIVAWALSPHGIRGATARIDNGALVFPMQIHERPDVLARFPWYPETPRPGLALTLPRRPKGTPRETDVQIEVVDGSGKKTRLPDIPFRWD